MKIIAIVFVLMCSLVAMSIAQPGSGKLVPGRSLRPNEPAIAYKDSTEFNKLFKEFYAIAGPKQTPKQDATDYLSRMSRSFVVRGLDSAKAMKAGLSGIDDLAYYKIYFDVYRRTLSAVELKKYLDFVKTPEGKKIVELMPQLQRVMPEMNAYVGRSVNTNMAPLMEEAREKMERERPPQKDRQSPSMHMVPPPHLAPPPIPPPAAPDGK